MPTAAAPVIETAPPPRDVKDAPEKPKKETNLGNQAQVIVEAPADAQIYVDGRRISVQSPGQPIPTPVLAPDRDYYYIVRARSHRDGQAIDQAQRVIVRAGHSSRVKFDATPQTAAAIVGQPARITVRVPDDAKLLVDGVVRSTQGGLRTFETPRLEPGKSYYYDFKAEMTRDGKPVSHDRQVVVESGKSLTVDFRGATELASARD
jgi:uncharacterized protein (TIGR03000 family)